MFFKRQSKVEKLGKCLGFLFSFSLFTTIFHWVSSHSTHAPSLIQAGVITCLIILFGYLLKEVLA